MQLISQTRSTLRTSPNREQAHISMTSSMLSEVYIDNHNYSIFTKLNGYYISYNEQHCVKARYVMTLMMNTNRNIILAENLYKALRNVIIIIIIIIIIKRIIVVIVIVMLQRLVIRLRFTHPKQNKR